jgi:hypothetical protein
MRRLAMILLAVALIATAGTAFTQSSAGFRLPWSVIAGGGGTSLSASYRVGGTIGQPAASPPTLESASYRISGGYWAGIHETPHFLIYLPLVVADSN